MATIKICDICGSQKDVETRTFLYVKSRDSKGSRTFDTVVYDLCPKHIIETFTSILQDLYDSGVLDKMDINKMVINKLSSKVING